MGINMSGISVANDPWPPPGNPIPTRFRVIRSQEVKGNLVVEIEYEGVKNYEGRKVLLYLGTDTAWLGKQKSIDPHFSESGGPFARFEPTHKGWDNAITLARMIGK
jgi:hypothetical protein